MAETPVKDLEKALDESLDALTKAATDETISKAGKSDEKKDEPEEAKGDKPAFLKKKGDKKDDADGDEDEDAKGDKKDEKDEEDEAMRGGYRKSVEDDITKSETVANAIEVSKFLRDFVKSVSEVMGDMKHRIACLEKSNRALAGAVLESGKSQVEVIKSMNSDIATLGGRPLPRKALEVSKVATIEKGFRNDEKTAEGGDKNLSKSQVSDRLAALEMERKVPYGTTTKFEMTGEMHKSFESLVYGEPKQ